MLVGVRGVKDRGLKEHSKSESILLAVKVKFYLH